MMATDLDHPKSMTWVRLLAATVLLTSLGLYGESQGQTPPVAAFKSSVDLVRVAAVVRDRKGRFVPDLTARDLEILDAGQPQSITDFRHDLAGVSVALLFDISGSMEGHLPNAREAGDAPAELARRRSRRGRRVRVRHRAGRARAVHVGPENASRLDAAHDRLRRDLAPRRGRPNRSPRRTAGRTTPRRGRVDRRHGHRQPADAA